MVSAVNATDRLVKLFDATQVVKSIWSGIFLSQTPKEIAFRVSGTPNRTRLAPKLVSTGPARSCSSSQPNQAALDNMDLVQTSARKEPGH